MKNFAKIADGLNIAPALAQITSAPELWGQNPERTDSPDSPHAQSKDIWLRYRPREELTSPSAFNEPHFAAFYPAWYVLPGLHAIVFDVMARMSAVYLGGILMTRIPAGGAILPHVDGGWHQSFLNCRAYVILKANERCINRCGDEEVILRPGEAWLFNNSITHSVENNGDDERIAAIITMRIER